MRGLLLWLFNTTPVRALVTKSFVFRPLVKRFVAGETIDEALAIAQEMAQDGFNVSLDQLGENVTTEAEALDSRAGYVDLVENIAQSQHKERINISIKLTQLGLDLDAEFVSKNYQDLLAAGAQHGVFIRVDMESSAYTQDTIDMVVKAHSKFPLTGTVLQSMLRRTDADIDRLLGEGVRMRIVKGAYLEPTDVAFQEKSVVDEKFVEQSKVLLLRSEFPGIATHDERIIEELKSFIKAEKISSDRFEWQMLYGVRRDLQQSLLEQGFNVRVYVPFGQSWYPYFTRRLLERPANILFIAKALFKK